MKLLFLPADHLESLKNSLEENLHFYKESDNKWVYSFFGNSPFREFKKEVPDFNLVMDSKKPESTDVKNAEILYKNLLSLTDTQASDERLWAGLTHGTFYNYMHYRWGNSNNSLTNVKSRYFFAQIKRRSLVRNPLSRLWWIGKYTYDEQYENPFELLKYFRTDFATKALYLFSSNFSSNDKIRKALLIAVNNFENKGIKIDRKKFNDIIMYLNLLGGTFLLDYYSKEDLISIIEEYATQLLNVKLPNERETVALTEVNA